MSEVKLCSTCVLNINSEFVPSEGEQCLYCKDFRPETFSSEKNTEEQIFHSKAVMEETIAKVKANPDKYGYDCLVLLSGGKDSTMALYHMKTQYDLRILALTIDNGLIFPTAAENINSACRQLEVDHIRYKPYFLEKIYRWVLTNQVPISICRFCNPLNFNSGLQFAKRFNIPLVIHGYSKAQSELMGENSAVTPLWEENIADHLQKLFEEIPEARNIGLTKPEITFLNDNDITLLSPWYHEDYDINQIRALLKEKLGWRDTEKSYPKYATNCMLYSLDTVLLRKRKGYNVVDCEAARLVRFGDLTREDALANLDADISIPSVHNVLNRLGLSLNDIGLTEKELEEYSHFQ